jgi:hypothetical protein
VPKIVDTRLFQAARADAMTKNGLAITLTVKSRAAQKNLALALWNIPREWRKGGGWWSVEGAARFVPVRAPFTANLNGLLVADLKRGENKFTVTIKTPARKLIASTVKISDSIEGRVYERDGQTTAYLWPTRPWATTLAFNLPAGKQANAYVAPKGERHVCTPGENRFDIPAGRWMRLTGLSAEEIALATESSSQDSISQGHPRP